MWLLNSDRDSSKWAVFCALGGGEAAAQLTPDNTFHGNGLMVDVVAPRVAEGASTTIAVTLKASVPANTPTTSVTVTVTVALELKGNHDATNEDTDVVLNPGTATLDFPANMTSSAVTHEISGTIRLQTIHDPDAEDETIVLAIEASGGGFSIGAGKHPARNPGRPSPSTTTRPSRTSWPSRPARRPGRARRSTWWCAQTPPTWTTA